MERPTPDPETVEQIVEIATGKCFDWAQDSIAETMALVAAILAGKSVAIKHELMEVGMLPDALESLMKIDMLRAALEALIEFPDSIDDAKAILLAVSEKSDE